MKTSADENQIVAVQYCTGYVDKQNQWRPGFNCSAQISKQQSSTPLYCCGTSNHKYCCSTKQYIQMGYTGGHNNDVTYGTLMTVVLSTFIFSVMLTIIAFVCCKKFWKSRENLNLELVDDQLYRNTNFLTLNAAQLINAHTYSGLPVQTTDAIQSTPSSSMNALHTQQTLLSPSITANNLMTNNSNSMSNSVNNNLPAIVTSMSPISSNQTGQAIGSGLYTSSTNSAQTYTLNQPPPNTIANTIANQQQMNGSINTTTASGQSSITMAGYSVHHPQALQQALIFYEAPPPYMAESEVHRAYTTDTSNQANLQSTNTMLATMTDSDLSNANVNINTINLLTNQPNASYQTTNQSNDERAPNTNDLPTNIWSQRLLLGLGNYRRDCVHPVLDQPRKKLCRTLSQ